MNIFGGRCLDLVPEGELYCCFVGLPGDAKYCTNELLCSNIVYL